MIRPTATWGIPLAFASGVVLWLLTYDAYILPTGLALSAGVTFDITVRVLPHAFALGALTGVLAPRTHPANLFAAAVLWPSLAIALHLGAALGGPADPDAPTPLWAAPSDAIGVAILTSLTVAAAAAVASRIRTQLSTSES